MSIRAVIFDCFGVLYRDNLSMLYDLVAPEQAQQLQDIIHATDHGFLSRGEYYEKIAELANVDAKAVRAVERRQHVRDDAMIQFTQMLKPKYKVGLLSNIDHETMERLFPLPERDALFDSFAISGDIGLTKPAPEVFEYAANDIGVRPEECVMIDDSAENCAGADAVGMKSIRYVSNHQIQSDLKKLLT